MKKLIYMLLAATMIASFGSQGAFAKAFNKNNFDGFGTPRTRGMINNDGNLTPLVNDDFAVQVDFKFPTTYLPLSFGSAFGIFTRTGSPSLAQSNGFSGYPANPAHVSFEIFPPQYSDTPDGPIRYVVLLGDGSASFIIKQGLAVTPDGLTTVPYDHNWHRIQFSSTGFGTGVSPGTVNFSIDGISFLALTGQTNLPLSKGGNFAIQFQGVQGQAIPAGHTAALDNVMLDNLRTATSLANLATAPVYIEDYESIALGSTANGNNGTSYVMGSDNGQVTQAAINDAPALTGASAQTNVQATEESDWINVIGGPVGSLPRGGCIYLNATAPGARYNLVANDYTTNANDQVGVQADIKFPTVLTGAEAVTSSIEAGITIRLRGTIGGNDATANSPGVSFIVGVVNSGPNQVFKFDVVNRTASNTAGTTLATFTSAIKFDHNWHRIRAKISQAGSAPTAAAPTPSNFNYPTLNFDGTNVIQATNNANTLGTFQKIYNTGSGATGNLSYPLDSNVVIPATVTPTAAPTPTPTLVTNNGFFGGGTNLGPIPTTPAATAFPNPATATATTYVAQDENFSIWQKMNVAVSANTKNVRFDNINTISAVSSGTGAAATRGTDAVIARIDDLSSYGTNSVGGVVANNTLLSAAPKSATLADPWYTDAAAGGSNPAQWSIDVTDNSTFGISSVNAVNDFYLY